MNDHTAMVSHNFVILFPGFTTEPSDKVVAIGQPLLLNCQVNHSGSGRIVVSWQNNGIWLLNPVNQPWRQHINNSLYYSSIPARSIGTFRCAATNLDTSEIIYSRTATVQAACKFFIVLLKKFEVYLFDV